MELSDECRIQVGPDHLLQERERGSSFILDEISLAGTHINEQTNSQRVIGLCSKVLYFATLAIYFEHKVVALEISHNPPVIVPDSHNNVKNFDINRKVRVLVWAGAGGKACQ